METKDKKVLGIRAEDFSKWERRCPLTPEACKELLSTIPGFRILVEPSTTRIFSDIEFARVGCEVSSDLSECDVILGVKQVPIKKLLPNKTFVFFSHVIKAQPGNMDMLDDILEKKIRLIDYEKICDAEGKRLVAFGFYAGFVGAVDILHGLGPFLINRGLATPFLKVPQVINMVDQAECEARVGLVGDMIKQNGLPHEIVPLVIGVSGYGRCGQGALTALKNLPCVSVKPEDLAKLVEDAKKNPAEFAHNVYLADLKQEHFVRVKGGAKDAAFDKKHYYEHPELYESRFEEDFLEYISVLVNCIYWEPKFPRLISSANIKKLEDEKRLRLLGISDVTCDFEGSIEFLRKFTEIDHPFFVYDPKTDSASDDYKTASSGILYDSIEIMPTELPLDATRTISKLLLPFIPSIVNSDISLPLEEQKLSLEIEGAVIALNGELTPRFKYIEKLRKYNSEFPGTMAVKSDKKTLESNDIHIKMEGHLFDRNSLKKVLDLLIDQGKLKVSISTLILGQSPTIATNCSLLVDNSSEFVANYQAQVEKILGEDEIKFQIVVPSS